MAIPVSNANTVKLDEQPGTLPNLQGGVLNYFRQLTFTTIKKTVVNFQLVEVPVSFNFMGMVQPMGAQKLMMKPEGQRHWVWNTIHAFPSLELTTDEIITISCVNYRVMQKFDYSTYGYVEYHVVQDYKAASNGG